MSSPGSVQQRPVHITEVNFRDWITIDLRFHFSQHGLRFFLLGKRVTNRGMSEA